MASRNKERGKRAERWVAEELGGARFPADSGGPIDVETDNLALQVKASLRWPSDSMIAAVDTARAGARNDLTPAAVFIRRYGRGKAQRAFVMMDLEDWKEWFGG